MTTIHCRAVRERIRNIHPGVQISREALDLVDRLINEAVDIATNKTIAQERHRITAGTMRRAIDEVK